MWYINTINKLNKNTEYTRKQIFEALHNEKPNFSDNSLKWIISDMVDKKILFRKQRNLYTLSNDASSKKESYNPSLSNNINKLIEIIRTKFPLVNFVCFESFQLNEFLNQLIANNTYFVMVEKDTSESIFRFLQEEKMKNVLFNPSEKEFDAYWHSESIIILNLVSEYPKNNNSIYGLSLEKLLVDLVAEKCFSYLYSKNEIKNIYANANKTYMINWASLLRYASRRGKSEEIKKIMEMI